MRRSPASIRVALVQRGWNERSREWGRDLDRDIRAAGVRGADLVCFPELAGSPYGATRRSWDLTEIAESVPGPSTQIACGAARSAGVAVVLPLAERSPQGTYNAAAVIDQGGRLVGTYRKTHFPHHPRLHERRAFLPGDIGFHSFDVGGFRIGVLICADLWYPESARALALDGSDLLICPAAIGHFADDDAVATRQRESWILSLRAAAFANGLPACVVNRSGSDAKLRYWGRSMVARHDGTVQAVASGSRAEVLLADIDLAAARRFRTRWAFLAHRRPLAYGPLVKES